MTPALPPLFGSRDKRSGIRYPPTTNSMIIRKLNIEHHRKLFDKALASKKISGKKVPAISDPKQLKLNL